MVQIHRFLCDSALTTDKKKIVSQNCLTNVNITLTLPVFTPDASERLSRFILTLLLPNVSQSEII